MSEGIDDFDLDSLFGDSKTSKKSKKKTAQPKNDGKLRGVSQAVKMRDTFRIPFVYRVKKRVLNAMLVLPVFACYMMVANHYSWDMGTKTYLLSLFSFMCFGGAYFFVSMIDPEDWRAVEKAQKARDISEL